jgi:hypothetical protein
MEADARVGNVQGHPGHWNFRLRADYRLEQRDRLASPRAPTPETGHDLADPIRHPS